MKRLIASFVVVMLAGCAGTSPSPSASAPPSGASPDAAVGPLGQPLATVEAELAAAGFSFVDQPSTGGAVIGRLGTASDGVGQALLVGDPLEALMFRIADPFLDFGPLHALLGTQGRDDVVSWKDDQVQALRASGGTHQASAEIGGDPVLFVGTVHEDGTMEMGFMMGDLESLGIPLPSPGSVGPSPSAGPNDVLGKAMTAYDALAQETNAELTLALAVLLDSGAPLEARVAGAQRVGAAEAGLYSGLARITWPTGVEAAATSLSDRTQATVLASQPLHTAATGEELEAALPALLDAIRAEATAAADVRSALLSFGVVTGVFASEPPPVGAGAVVTAPGELVASGRGFSLMNGDGSMQVSVENPTNAFALGVTITVEIYAYEGPLVDTRTLSLGVVAPGTTGTAVQDIVGLRPPGLTPQRLEVTSIGVETWRATADPTLLGR